MFKPLTIRQAADLAALACLAELAAEKPGNVTLRHGLPGLTPTAFLHSAAALRAAFFQQRGRSVGRLVLDTVRRTRRRVGTNTNLGLALILAPLAIASSAPRRPGPGDDRLSLRERVRHVLRGLTLRDARDVYAAIRLAQPGGMGRVRHEDISSHPRRDLRACMALAVRRDSIAAEYARDYAITFGSGAPALRRALRQGSPPRDATLLTFVWILARSPDSLIARRHGPRAARLVSRLAAGVLRAGGPRTAAGRRKLAALDARLRAARLNPGTTADLAAAALFVALADPGRTCPENPRQSFSGS